MSQFFYESDNVPQRPCMLIALDGAAKQHTTM